MHPHQQKMPFSRFHQHNEIRQKEVGNFSKEKYKSVTHARIITQCFCAFYTTLKRVGAHAHHRWTGKTVAWCIFRAEVICKICFNLIKYAFYASPATSACDRKKWHYSTIVVYKESGCSKKVLPPALRLDPWLCVPRWTVVFRLLY